MYRIAAHFSYFPLLEAKTKREIWIISLANLWNGIYQNYDWKTMFREVLMNCFFIKLAILKVFSLFLQKNYVECLIQRKAPTHLFPS